MPGRFSAPYFICSGLLTALSVYALTLRLSSARPAAIMATGLLVFSPSFVLYENWLMYSFPAAALLTMSAWALYRYLRDAANASGASLFRRARHAAADAQPVPSGVDDPDRGAARRRAYGSGGGKC